MKFYTAGLVALLEGRLKLPELSQWCTFEYTGQFGVNIYLGDMPVIWVNRGRWDRMRAGLEDAVMRIECATIDLSLEVRKMSEKFST